MLANNSPSPSAPSLDTIDEHRYNLLYDTALPPVPQLVSGEFSPVVPWIPNTEGCQACDEGFPGGRHHCRRCGLCICGRCSVTDAYPVRVCAECAEETRREPHRLPLRQSAWAVRLALVQQDRDTQGVASMVQPRLTQIVRRNPGEFFDRLLDALSHPAAELSMDDREVLLALLLRSIRVATVASFNEAGRRTRLERIRVLLMVENEETETGEQILDVLEYKCVMFEKIVARIPVKYTLVMDKSGSMAGSLWAMAQEATEHMAEQIEVLTREACPDGMDLWMFSSDYVKYEGLRRCKDVEAAYERQRCGGGTNLCAVLEALFRQHAERDTPEHILVVTDGQPNKPRAVKRALVNGINSLLNPQDFGITFMQIGTDASAEEFLHSLQDDLLEDGARYSVIDALVHTDYGDLDICKFIHKYLPEQKHHDGDCTIF